MGIMENGYEVGMNKLRERKWVYVHGEMGIRM